MVVDDEEKVIGIISLSDILLYLVLRPCGEDPTTNGVTSSCTQTTSISQSISDSELEHTIPEEDAIEDQEELDDSAKTDVAESEKENSLPTTPTMETPSLADNVGFREVTVSGGEWI